MFHFTYLYIHVDLFLFRHENKNPPASLRDCTETRPVHTWRVSETFFSVVKKWAPNKYFRIISVVCCRLNIWYNNPVRWDPWINYWYRMAIFTHTVARVCAYTAVFRFTTEYVCVSAVSVLMFHGRGRKTKVVDSAHLLICSEGNGNKGWR